MSDELIGQKLGAFTILSRLGQGGMASVYRAQQQSLDREVALKVIRRIPGDAQDLVARFQREKQMMQKLEHPNILPIYDYASNADYLWIAMRLVEGGTLPEGQTAPQRLASVARQLASALDFAHSHGVIHRDIKPHNVLVDRGEHLYLTDFGVAKMLEQEGLTAPGMAVGTPEYMSPEQLSLKEFDGRSDQYALAVMMYQLGCGHLPFTGNMVEVMTAHMRTPPPAPTGLPAGASAAILKALAKDPNQRFASCSEFAEALAEGLAGSNPVKVPSSSKKKPPVKTLAGVALLVLGLGAFWAWPRPASGKPGPLVFEAIRNSSQEVQLRFPDGSVRSLGLGMYPRFGPGPSQVTLVREGSLLVVDTNGKKIDTLAQDVNDFDISADTLVYTRKGLRKCQIANGKLSGKPVQLNEDGRHPALSPDGKQLAFEAERAIWIMDLKTGQRRTLSSPTPEEYDSKPCWSPDASELVFRRDKHKEVALYRISLAGKESERPIPISGVEPISACWAPNSNLAFSSRTGLYTVSVDGSGLQRLVEAPKGVILSRPVWGPTR
ncbi:serine/threonine-protein kinase [bacterium]|nr:serine/threonine-protein kinase [bacterium]